MVGIIIVVGITIAGTKSIINAGIITGIGITIARVIGCTAIVIIMMIIVHHIKGRLWDSNSTNPDLNLRLW
jgi:ABC-type phosphate transport system permease subunit